MQLLHQVSCSAQLLSQYVCEVCASLHQILCSRGGHDRSYWFGAVMSAHACCRVDHAMVASAAGGSRSALHHCMVFCALHAELSVLKLRVSCLALCVYGMHCV
jgi:hypothetical protein